jgi:ribonuclease T2
MRTLRPAVTLTVLGAVFLATGFEPSKRRREGEARSGDFAYYVLALSWAPDFCATTRGPKDPRECGKGRKVGFVVHGLWPQGEQGRGPVDCGPARPVSRAIVERTIGYVPTEGLIQHEWRKHGTCSGLSVSDYFATLRKARDLVKIPDALTAPGSEMHMSPGEIEALFAAANPAFPRGAFRVSCKGGGLQEARICLNKDLTVRDCSSSAGFCNTGKLLVRPVQ